MNLNKSDYKVNVSKKKQYKLNIIVVSIDDKKEETLFDKIKDLVDKEKFVVYSVHQDVIGMYIYFLKDKPMEIDRCLSLPMKTKITSFVD